MDNNSKTYMQNDGLENAPILSKLQGKNSISIPDGYFDKLEDDIMTQINPSEIANGNSHTLSYKKMMYYVAAASVVVLLSFFAVRFVNTTPQKDIIVEKSEGSIKEDNNGSPKSTDNSLPVVIAEDNNIPTFESKKESIIVNNETQTIEEVGNNNIEKNVVKDNVSEDTYIDKEIIVQNIDQNEDYEIGNNTSAGAFSSSGSNMSHSTTTRATTARTSNSKFKNILLPTDTCTNKAFVIRIPSDSIYNIVWNDNSTAREREFTESGTYWLQLFKANTLIQTDTIRVSIIPLPELLLAHQFEICNHQSLLLNTGLNDVIYHHNWSISNNHKSEILLENLTPGTIDLELTVASCCDTISEQMILYVQDCNISIPNIITPNNDGFNDAFVITGLDYYPNSSLNIFDRKGKVIFQSIDYHNDWKAENIIDGTYFYSLIINDGKKTEKGGVVKVMR